MKGRYDGRVIGSNDPRARKIQVLSQQLDAVLHRFASSSGAERQQNLTEILKRAARFGYILFSQPTDWVFDWQLPRGASPDEAVVFPALVQIGDDQGERRTVPQRLGEEARQIVYIG